MYYLANLQLRCRGLATLPLLLLLADEVNGVDLIDEDRMDVGLIGHDWIDGCSIRGLTSPSRGLLLLLPLFHPVGMALSHRRALHFHLHFHCPLAAERASVQLFLEKKKLGTNMRSSGDRAVEGMGMRILAYQ